MATAAKTKLDVAVNKPTPYTFDLGLLLANDPNPMNTSSADPSAPLEDRLSAVARDGAQALINQLLTTLPLNSTTDGVLLSLPSSIATPLPREKPLPAAKEQTKWEKFAARKGIRAKTKEQRSVKDQRFNEDTGEWERTWGHDRGGKATARQRARDDGAVQRDWIVEVDESAGAEAAAGRGGGRPNGKGKGKKRKV